MSEKGPLSEDSASYAMLIAFHFGGESFAAGFEAGMPWQGMWSDKESRALHWACGCDPHLQHHHLNRPLDRYAQRNEDFVPVARQLQAALRATESMS